MENNFRLPDNIQAAFDHKRFPTMWQAILGCASMQFVAGIALFIITLFMGADYSEKFRSAFGADMFAGLLSQFFAVLIVPLFILLTAKKDMRATLRLKKNLDIVQLILLVMIMVGIFFLAQTVNSVVIQIFTGFMGPASDVATVTEASSLSQLLFELVIIAGLPAICEEIFFRGLVLRAFERISPVVAVLVSSIAFAVMHGNLQQVPYAFIMGIVFGTTVIISDSLLAGTVLHFIANAASVILMYPSVYTHYESFAMNNEGLYMLVTMVALPLAGVIGMLLFIQYSRNKNKRFYGSKFTSDMLYPKLMPKQKSWETALHVLGWIAFIGINVLSMLMLWFYDPLMAFIGA